MQVYSLNQCIVDLQKKTCYVIVLTLVILTFCLHYWEKGLKDTTFCIWFHCHYIIDIKIECVFMFFFYILFYISDNWIIAEIGYKLFS